MGKTIIALKGKANIGKTETIREFRNVLKKAYPSCDEQLLKDNIDIKTVIEITHNNNKVKIGIESQGDPYSRLTDEKLESFISGNCKIIVCACRTKGDTVGVIHQVARDNNYNHIFTSNYVSSCNRNALNLLMAQHLLSLVEKIAWEGTDE